MKKKILFGMVFVLSLFQTVNAQTILKEISLNQQIKNSSLVIEGRVLSKKSYWDINHENIYTVNRIEVSKIFKGDVVEVVEIITPGGVVNLDAQVVTPSLKLEVDDIGVFTLSDVSSETIANKGKMHKQLRAYSSLQGFYRYSKEKDIASNIFKVYEGIGSVLHNNIETITQVVPIQIVNLELSSQKKVLSSSIANKLAFTISSFTPTQSTAGTKSVLTINGNGFGALKGKVAFANADTGGTNYVHALDSEVLSWNDTQIKVEIPSSAGTGKVMVIRNDESSLLSNDNLTITFSQANIISDAASPGNDVAYITHLIDKNGTGGYTWYATEQFANVSGAKDAFGRALETWTCETNVNWELNGASIGSSIVNQHRASNDGYNVIAFDNSNTGNPDDNLPETVLGRRTSYFRACFINGGSSMEWYIEGFDIVFDYERNWNFNDVSVAGTELFDFESIALHELGHCRQLDHIIDTNNVMHFAIAKGEELRFLSDENVAAASWVHNRSSGTIACNQPSMIDYSCQGLGIEEELLNQAVSIYPNPTKGILNVKNDTSVLLEKIDVYDISSRLILTQNLSQENRLNSINFKGVSKGVYLVNIYSDKTLITKKIIVH